MKFPFILFFRHDQYKDADMFFETNAATLDCSIYITNNYKKVEKLHNANFHLLITYGSSDKEYNDELLQIISEKMFVKRLHFTKLPNIATFNKYINTKFITNCSLPREFLRPTFSLFTPSFNSFHKIMRVYESLKEQTLKDWEWVIMDDSPDDKHFQFLRKNFQNDNRIRFYRHSQNNGSIGNVKNETIGLCRGKYVLEMDHDDEILPDVLQDAANLFEEKPDVGFIYMDFICVYESGANQWYGDFICKGYGGYYSMKYKDKWRLVYMTPNINNITLSHLVCCPNHPRIWRRDFLLELGSYSEHLHICDDYEILIRTGISAAEKDNKKRYKSAKIPKLGYVQYMNDGENNFSLIRNAEINRLGPIYISPIYYQTYNIHEKMKEIDAYEDEKYLNEYSKIWLRDSATYTHKYCNLIVNPDFNYQICIIGYDSLLYNLEHIRSLLDSNTKENADFKYDFILLENKCTNQYLWSRLEYLKLDKIKCYSLIDHTNEELTNYFKVLYLSTEKYEILDINIQRPKYNTEKFFNRHEVINHLTNKSNKYLEIGVESGYTYNNVHFDKNKKTGVDPDPKYSDSSIVKCTSDDFFQQKSLQKYDVIFIDGMHHVENVLRDFNNSVNILNKNGSIFIDDIIPLNYNEQLKIPERHYYENGILKYGEEWTGDIWKIIYYLLVHCKDQLSFSYYYNINYRGIAHIKIKHNSKKIKILEDALEEINKYEYFKDFNNYLQLVSSYII
jgi:glycosyltransferase involved in cell wall biosynthesis